MGVGVGVGVGVGAHVGVSMGVGVGVSGGSFSDQKGLDGVRPERILSENGGPLPVEGGGVALGHGASRRRR